MNTTELSPALEAIRSDLLRAIEADSIAHVAPSRRSRPRIRLTRFVVALGAIAVAATSVALAQNVIFDSRGPARNIDQLTESVTKVSRSEYDAVAQSVRVPNSPRVGVIGEDEMRETVTLAPFAEARVVVDDDRVGRVVAVPIVGSDGLCLYYRPIHHGASTTSCDPQFDESGALPRIHSYRDSDTGLIRWSVYGIAADDVSHVELELASGAVLPVALVENAFFWDGRPMSKPAVFRVERNGVIHSKELPSGIFKTR